jgi:hypothetical protein
MTMASDSISNNLAEIKKNTPMGESLDENGWSFIMALNYSKKTHQITHEVIIIIASLNVTKTSNRGFPLLCMIPRHVPRITENMTKPNTLVVWVNSEWIS